MFSFGVLLLHLLTGRHPDDPSLPPPETEDEEDEDEEEDEDKAEQGRLVSWVKSHAASGRANAVFDAGLMARGSFRDDEEDDEDEDEEEEGGEEEAVAASLEAEMAQALKVGLVCCVSTAEERPSMLEVVDMLERARETAAAIRQTPALRDLLE